MNINNMSIRNFLLEYADFYKKDLDNFINLFKKAGIEENALDKNVLEILEIISKLTGIEMRIDKRLSSENSVDFKESLNDPEFQEKLLSNIGLIISKSKEVIKNQKDQVLKSDTEEKKIDFSSDIISKKTESFTKQKNEKATFDSKSPFKHEDKVSTTSVNDKSTKHKQSPDLFEQSEDIMIGFDQKKNSSERKISIKEQKQSTNQNTTKTFYYQIHQENLNSIYDCGMICPAKYTPYRTQADIQDKYNSYIILSLTESIYNDNDSKQILLEIQMTSNEMSYEELNDGLFLFNVPLPISRISRIIYTDKQYWAKLQGLIASDATSFIPECIAIYKSNLPVKNVALDYKAPGINIDYKDKLNIYNKRLGALAFMKNANLHYGVYSNYSDNYFRALSELDSDLIKMNFINNLDKSLRIAMNTELEKVNYIYADTLINQEYLETKLKENNNSLDRLPKGRFTINKKDYIKAIEEHYPAWFNVAFLAIYGDKTAASTASINLKSQFSSEVKNRDKADTILALLGAYYGYTAIRPHDQITTTSNDKLSSEIDVNTHIKFRMDSQLDYLTIETIYKRTFFNQTADKNFIISFAPTFKGNNQVLDKFKRYNGNKYYTCSKEMIHDVEYVRIIQKNKKSVVNEIVNTNYKEKISASKTLFTWIYNFFFEKGIIRISNNDIFVNKTDLINEIEKIDSIHFEKYDIEMFDELSDIDIRFKR